MDHSELTSRARSRVASSPVKKSEDSQDIRLCFFVVCEWRCVCASRVLRIAMKVGRTGRKTSELVLSHVSVLRAFVSLDMPICYCRIISVQQAVAKSALAAAVF